MLNPRSPVVVGFFAEILQAERALEVVRVAGFSASQVFVLLQDKKVSRYQLIENLLKMGMLEEEASYCALEYASGYSIVALKHEGRRLEAITILYNHRIHLYRKRLQDTDHTFSSAPITRQVEEVVPSAPIAPPASHSTYVEQPESESMPDWKRLLIDAGLDTLLDQLP